MKSYKDDILNLFHAELPWEKLSSKNILVTGATGLIGGCLVEALMSNPNQDYHVYASGRNKNRAEKRFQSFIENPYFHFIKYDVTSQLVSDINFHYIIDAASNASPNFFKSNPVEVIKANILGVSHLIEYGIKHGMERFLYVSTGEIYGEGDGRVFTEDYSGYVNITEARSCYPSSKRTGETLCVSYASEYGADVVIARPCHIYGPYFSENDNRVYAQFIRNVWKDENIIMKSTGTQYRSWCYVVDCVSALLHILLKGKNGEAYNVADTHSNITIKELAELIAEIAGKEMIVDLNEKEQSIPAITKAIFSTQKLQELGWNVSDTIRDKMINTIRECHDWNL